VAPAAGDRPVASGSLRRRIVVSTLLLLLTVLVSLGVLVDVILSNRLHADLRQRLTERAKYASVLAGRGLTGQQLADDLTGQGITGSVQSGGQTYIGRDQPPGGPPGRGNGGPGGANRPGTTTATATVTMSRHGAQLFAQVQLASSSLLLTTSEAEIDHTMSVLRTVELAAGAVTLLVAGALSFTVVGGALAPLRKMTALADRIRAGDRGRRLRPRHPNTDLGRTATALDAMLDSLEDAESDAQSAELRMRQFLADASHDLRTPLAVMSAGAEQLLRSDPGRVERERLLVELIREGRRAGRLVDDLLLMARLDDPDPSSALMRSEVDLVELLGAAVRRVRPLIRDRQIDFKAPAGGGLVVAADADRLTRVVMNLLDNARDATSAGGRISVVASGERGQAVIDVRDDGPGVPTGQHERIFDRFVRLDETRRRGGTGLGLPIARAIARAHGGELRSLSASVGAHFRLELTLVVVAERDQPSAAESAEAELSLKPLVVSAWTGPSRSRR
jgi:two-component system OmpR family sensor kinase